MFGKVGLFSMKNVPESLQAGIGATLFYCSELESETSEHKYNFNCAFTSLCPFQGSFKKAMFSSTDLHMKIFIANFVLSAVRISNKNVEQRNNVPSTCQAIQKLINYSSVPQKTFKASCNKVKRSRRKALRTTISTCSDIAEYLQERLTV